MTQNSMATFIAHGLETDEDGALKGNAVEVTRAEAIALLGGEDGLVATEIGPKGVTWTRVWESLEDAD